MPWYRIPHTDERMWHDGERPDLELIEEEQPVAEPAAEADGAGDA